MPAKRPRRDWSIEEKIRILATASTKEVLRVPKGKRGIPLTARYLATP
jgi:hypothetical protein